MSFAVKAVKSLVGGGSKKADTPAAAPEAKGPKITPLGDNSKLDPRRKKRDQLMGDRGSLGGTLLSDTLG